MLQRVAVIAAVVSFSAGTAQASTTTLVKDNGVKPVRRQRCVDRALVPTPNATITIRWVTYDPRTGRGAGIAYSSMLEPVIYFGDAARVPGALDCHALLHEVGHQFDRVALTDDDRYTIARVIFHDDATEWVARTSAGHNGPLEWFAELYSFAARHRRIGRHRDMLDVDGEVGYASDKYMRIGDGRLRLFRQMLHAIAARG